MQGHESSQNVALARSPWARLDGYAHMTAARDGVKGRRGVLARTHAVRQPRGLPNYPRNMPNIGCRISLSLSPSARERERFGGASTSPGPGTGAGYLEGGQQQGFVIRPRGAWKRKLRLPARTRARVGPGGRYLAAGPHVEGHSAWRGSGGWVVRPGGLVRLRRSLVRPSFTAGLVACVGILRNKPDKEPPTTWGMRQDRLHCGCKGGSSEIGWAGLDRQEAKFGAEQDLITSHTSCVLARPAPAVDMLPRPAHRFPCPLDPDPTQRCRSAPYKLQLLKRRAVPRPVGKAMGVGNAFRYVGGMLDYAQATGNF